ncbi:MAG: hypothetical protein JWM08_1535 [Candidatus Angelobacter sp.]|nr:hypothetical protein [Candidatus Angelobacter sp.]
MRIQQKFIRSIAVSLGMLFLLSIMAAAVEPVPLPDIQLTAADGSTVKSNALPSQGNWLIIYIQPRNQFSDNLLRTLKRDQYPTLAQHAVIIVGGSIEDLKIAQMRFPELAQATWYADTNKSAFGLMKLTGAPMILGIKQRTITWSLSGILSDVNVAKSILNTWVEG